MSDTSDDMEAGSCEYEYYLEKIQDKLNNIQKNISKNSKKGIWQTSAGDIIDINKITDSHKKNIIKWAETVGIDLPKQIKSYRSL